MNPNEQQREKHEAHESNDAPFITESPPGMPRWVKILGVISIALFLFILILHLTGNAPLVHHGMQNEVRPQ
jgi:hypothetical protein